ncbi:hypothetical protein [Actinomycetospora termitidis]|uniref:Uncharacterized protein n=1 Tax=Actinomycetospora termitidis TaxID=3053470 RepID=A0ABT7MG82_9PSEU|nr:hypothetical protein [Actinomycetospora sp. Odt1-22]MDL5159164.1 hypothetical protein [Actinomycetospora sp. Odt1-22]
MSGDTMMITAAAIAVGTAAGAWIATPFLAMSRRGTLDDQARAAMRAEADRADAVRRARRRETLVAVASVSVPAQRRPVHDDVAVPA